MLLSRKVKNRMLFLILLMTVSVIAIFFIIKTLDGNILYFSSPSDVNQKEDIVFDKLMRIGGMVKDKSITTKLDTIQFTVTDFKHEIIVSYSGTVPNLFKEGKGVVVEGILKDKNFFIASRILAKHDENYMPIEIKKLAGNNVK
jgi:cytochrome c-type biogenesis protein CcmE